MDFTFVICTLGFFFFLFSTSTAGAFVPEEVNQVHKFEFIKQTTLIDSVRQSKPAQENLAPRSGTKWLGYTWRELRGWHKIETPGEFQ